MTGRQIRGITMLLALKTVRILRESKIIHIYESRIGIVGPEMDLRLIVDTGSPREKLYKKKLNTG
jgi:hypothetical protein